MYTHAYIYMCTYLYTHKYIHACMHTCIYMCMYPRTHTSTHTDLNSMCMHTNKKRCQNANTPITMLTNEPYQLHKGGVMIYECA